MNKNNKFGQWSNFKNGIIRISCLPHIRVCLIVLLVAVISILISTYCEKSEAHFAASIFSNVFAGLITGLIICIISSVKQLSAHNIEFKKIWLEELKKLISDYINVYSKLVHTPFAEVGTSEDLFNFIYEVGSHANWVNEYIIQSKFNKSLPFNPYEYCKEKFDYDAIEKAEVFSLLHDKLYLIDMQKTTKKMVLRYFEDADKLLHSLSIYINNEMKELDNELSLIYRTII